MSQQLPLQPEQELPKDYKENLIFDKNQDLSEHVFKTCLDKICKDDPREKSIFLIKLKEFCQLRCDMMTEIEFNLNSVHDRNDSNYKRAKNCKEKILCSPKFEAQQECDYVIDAYFEHLSKLELGVKVSKMASTRNYNTENIIYDGIEITVRHKECTKCKNQLIEPKDFDSESLSQEFQVSLHSSNTYYETDADDFIEQDNFTYIINQNGIVLNDKLYFSDSELRIDDSLSSKYNSL
ncbi:10780_t:CDS:2 [Cetraspora pellucida]|uniref:10780_t:CDS:1 n=1 Tax=Cetraspora pellucida TaxID=1433469 RepID=A0A9N9GL11_9GLOM|nr:10780_t:CDS:2 [Cetraspora pellucida]